MTDGDRFTVTVSDAERPVGRLLVLPGAGYTVDHPLLFWACTVAASAGWQVTSLRWRPPTWTDRSEATAFVEQGATLLDESAPAATTTVVLAKSLGTTAAGWAQARGYPGIWLTPLLTVPTVRDALASSALPHLLIGGTADSLWDSTAAHAIGGEVVEFDGADHALHVGNDWRRSLEVLGRALGRIEAFLLARTTR